MARPRNPQHTGWHDQMRAVLATADKPMYTGDVCAAARIIPSGTYAHEDIAKRKAMDIGQAGYRYLTRLLRDGYVVQTYDPHGSWSYWQATTKLKEEWSADIMRLEVWLGVPYPADT